MTFLEAKAHAMCNTVKETFEKAYECKVPQEVQKEYIAQTIAQFNILQAWLDAR